MKECRTIKYINQIITNYGYKAKNVNVKQSTDKLLQPLQSKEKSLRLVINLLTEKKFSNHFLEMVDM